MPYAASARRPAASSTPSSIITPAPSQPSSPGWNISTTSPRRRSRCWASSRAPPTSAAVCRSWPQACMAPLVEAKSSPVSSSTGSASMSARSSTVLGSVSSRASPRSTAVTEVVPEPVEISRPRPSSSASTVSWVRGRSRPISGCWCSRRRRSVRSSAMSRASSYRSTRPPGMRRCGSGHNSPVTSEPLVLGIETSCDETGVGIVRGHTLLADAVASSVEEHARFGGVVPEVASRAHLEAMVPTIERACETAGVALADVDAIAVTAGPGLAGALLVGVAAAKALALGLDKPLYGVNHLAAHVAVDQLEHGPLPDPCLAMLVSGGHSSLLRVADVTSSVEPLGSTIDDAAGEAFDKVARVLGLPFPGRPLHRPRSRVRVVGGDRLPARAHLAPRPRAAPLRLLLLRAQDRGGALGAGARGVRGAGARGRRRGVLPGGRLRRAHPQGGRRGAWPRGSRTS